MCYAKLMTEEHSIPKGNTALPSLSVEQARRLVEYHRERLVDRSGRVSASHLRAMLFYARVVNHAAK